MRKRRWISLVLVLAATAALVSGACGCATPALSLQSRDPASAAWSGSREWTWSFERPGAALPDGKIALRVRVRASVLTEKTGPSIQAQEKAMFPDVASRDFGIGMLFPTAAAKPPSSGTVSIQLLDLARIGAASSKAGQDLRFLAKLRMGDAETELAGDDVFLPAGRFAGYSARGHGRWTDNELYLMTFYVQNDRDLSQFDVFLEYSTGKPVPPPEP
ncbi:MAG: hypothetical protein AAB215_05955 [Planctomycetota bacterium]